MHRVGNILQTALADILERNLDDLAHLIVDGLRDADASGLGHLLQADRNVHPGSVEIIIFGRSHRPRLTPMRNCICCFSGTEALRSAISFWISTAQRTASTMLGNSATTPSPAAAEDMAAMGGDRLLNHSAIHAQGGCGASSSTPCGGYTPSHRQRESQQADAPWQGPPYAEWR